MLPPAGSIHVGLLALTGIANFQRLGNQSNEDRRRLLQLVQDYGKVADAIDGILDDCVSACAETVPLESPERVGILVSKLALSKLSCKCSPGNSRRLCGLVSGLLDLEKEGDGCHHAGAAVWCAERFLTLLDFYCDFDPILAVPDALLSQSRVLQGVCANVSAVGSLLLARRDPERPSRLVAAKCSLDDFSLASAEASIAVGSGDEYCEVTGNFEALCRGRLRALREGCGIDAVVSTKAFGAKLQGFARELGMELFFCPEEDQVDRICSALGILPMQDFAAGGALSSARAKLALITKSGAVVLNARACESAGSGSGHEACRTVLLCSPNPTTCEQYRRLLRQSIKLVRAAVERVEGRAAGTSAIVRVVPGACAVEKRLLRAIDATLRGDSPAPMEDSIRLGLETARVMAKEPMAALAGSMAGTSAREGRREVLQSLLDPSDAVLCLDLFAEDCSQGFSKRVTDPGELGVLAPARAYHQAYRSALQVVHQVLRLMPLTPGSLGG